MTLHLQLSGTPPLQQPPALWDPAPSALTGAKYTFGGGGGGDEGGGGGRAGEGPAYPVRGAIRAILSFYR